jgi:hypothetical protein
VGPGRVGAIVRTLLYSALLAFLLGDVNAAAARSPAKLPRPRALLSVSISPPNSQRVTGVARCVNSPLADGVRGTIAFGDGSTKHTVTFPTTTFAHTYRHGPPYAVRLTCRGTQRRVAWTVVTIGPSP